ncbi:hypothetical protein CGCF415_v003057 [Colletotrichum fructicola]|nr:hypothetical protein CGCFRS4_v003901 [Colletotrichum fructicola]KAF4913491.1 hypothetical protein CGCF415_v003057 [Colletotrichum fructicola]KAF4942638.1 hypothetical protein CGCF245_v000588 [Colletotrichum fructicola]
MGSMEGWLVDAVGLAKPGWNTSDDISQPFGCTMHLLESFFFFNNPAPTPCGGRRGERNDAANPSQGEWVPWPNMGPRTRSTTQY